jgi:cation-transporting ATPase E
MANVERVATLFVLKNVWSAILSVAVAVAAFPYPFLPRQLSLISALTVGIPAFFLALVPNPRRYQPGFLRRVLKLSIPAGVLVGLGVFASYALARVLRLTREEASTAACVTAVVVSLWIIIVLGRSLYLWKIGLVVAMGGLFVLALLIAPARDYLELSIPLRGLGEAALIGAAVSVLISVWWRLALRGESRAAARAVGGR